MNHETLFSEDFEGYRKLEAEKCVQIIRELITGHKDGEFFQGAMWMLKAIINLPLDSIDPKKSPEAFERAKFLKESMMSHLESKMARTFLNEE